MKKFISLLLVTLLLAAVFVACDNEQDTPEQTSPSEQEVTTPEETTEELTVPVTTEPETTEAPTEPEETTLNELGLPFEIYDVPVGLANGKPMRGYSASGYFFYNEKYESFFSDTDNNMMVVVNDTMQAGSLSATLLCPLGDINDNGIIFGLEEIPTENEDYYFWEAGPAYYFLFVSDARELYLAKAGFNGQAWTPLAITDGPLENYTHGEDEITISVEFDGLGSILCYVNDELLIEYYDDDPITGCYYGVRCEVFGVEYYNIEAIHD